MNVGEPITLRELMAEMLPQWESKALEGMDVCIPDANDTCVEEMKANRAYLGSFISHEQILGIKGYMLN